MKFLYPVIAMMLFPLSLAAQISDDEWEELKSHEGNFTVSIPMGPAYQAQEIPSEAGNITMHMFISERDNGAKAFVVFYNDIPEVALEQGVDAILENARNGALQSQNGQLKEDAADITLGKHQGSEFHFTASPQGAGDTVVHCSWRIYVIDNRMYQVGIASQDDDINDGDRSKLFDSFRLLRE